MNMKRSKAAQNKVGGLESLDLSYGQEASAIRVQGPMLGKVTIMGALNAAKGASKMGRVIAVYNNSTTTAFAKTGADSSVTAPSGGADGICLKPNDYTYIAMGSDLYIIASAATCFGYELVDELEYNPASGSNS